LDSRSTLKKRYNYKYDKKGNWIKLIKFKADSSKPNLPLEPTHILERIITYFPA